LIDFHKLIISKEVS